MLVLAVTHPDAVNRQPRSLSQGGRQQALSAARRLRELLGKSIRLGLVAASPSARCLETAIVVAREFGETTKNDGLYGGRIEVFEELAERRGEVGNAETLHSVLSSLRNKLALIMKTESVKEELAVLLAVHGDLANMLKGSAQFSKDFLSNDGQWFESRPIVTVFTASLTVKVCEAFSVGEWVSCI
jgi:broad specificity phosphatase PhoE